MEDNKEKEIKEETSEESTSIEEEKLDEPVTPIEESTIKKSRIKEFFKKENLKEFFQNLIHNKKAMIGIGVVLVAIIVLMCFLLTRNKKTYDETYYEPTFTIKNIEKLSSGEYAENNETFVVETEKGSLEKVKKHLVIEPAVSYEVTKKGRNTYFVTVKDLPSDKIINLKYIDNDVVEDKWAFQSTKDLTVTSVYPANNTSNISTHSTIEISFSYPNIDDISNSVVIEPKVEGTFVKSGRTWIFHHEKPFEEDKTYTITIKDDIKVGDKKLKEGVKSTFSTYNTSESGKALNYNSITIDNIATFRTNENPMFITSKEIAKVEVLQFNSSDDFNKYISNETNYKIKTLGNVSFKKLEHNLFVLNKTYKEGYYLEKAYYENGQLSFAIPMQINNLQSYVLATQNDLLVWTSSNNKLASDIPITYSSQNTKTDKDGIATIKRYNNKDEKVKYMKVGKNNPLFIGIQNVDSETLPHGYIYTDRPLYKNTDDVNIFGYIPLKYYEDKISKDQFVLSLKDEKIPIEIKDDGTFTAKYHLDNYKDSDLWLDLSYKNQTIATRFFEVKEYEKEMYNFKIDMEKNYVDAGKPFEFSVTVNHISGVTVPNKEIQVILDKKVLTAKTNYNGVAKFSLPTSREEQPGSYYSGAVYHTEHIQVKSSLTEAAQEGIGISYYVIDNYAKVTDFKYDSKNNEANIKVDTLTTAKSIKNVSWDMSSLIDKPYNGNIKIELEETKRTRRLIGYEYNEITKEKTPDYEYDTDTNIVSTESFSVKNGKLKYKNKYKMNKSTEETSYSYYLITTIKDKNNNEVKSSHYIYDYQLNDNNKVVGYYRSDYNIVSNEYYNLYNYYMPEEEISYSVNSPIIRSLYSYKGDKEVSNNKFLLIKYKNNIIDKKILDKVDSIKTTFNDDDRAGIEITGAYLKDGNFYRLPPEYLDYNKEDSRLDISLKPNKKQYTPKEEVTLDIKVTKKDKGIKSKVNISVVDEGVFKSSEDSTNILNNIYSNLNYHQYTYSTHRDYSLYMEYGGLGSTGGPTRSDFGDTIIFKTIETDSSGNARLKFKMNDSITSFRITAHATTDDVDLGDTHTNIESSLPVSISFKKPQGVKESDDVVLNAIGLGSTNEEITYDFTIKETNKKITKKGKISDNVFANFGKLKAGNYTAIISAKTKKAADKVEYKFTVTKTQTEISVKNTSNVKKTKSIKPTKNPIILELYRSIYKEYSKYLEILKETDEDRLDIKYSYYKGLVYDNKYNDLKGNPELGDISKFKNKNGYKYLPGEKEDYTLTAILTYYDNSLGFNKNSYYEKVNSNEMNTKMDGYINLAAMKEPILDDLHQISTDLDGENLEKLALSYIFLGDYNSAKKCYKKISNVGLKTYLSTFIEKEKAKEKIDKLYATDKADRYLYFSIISFFENNNVDLSSKENITVYHEDKKEEFELSSLGMKKITIYQKDLKDLKFKTKYKDIYVNYYYDGLLDDIDESHKKLNIKADLPDKTKLGSTIKLKINIKEIDNYTTLNLYLPNGLTLGEGFSSNFASINSNTKEKLSIYIGEKNSNTISIPLYASSPGEYVLEPIVIKKGNKYQVSNVSKITITE